MRRISKYLIILLLLASCNKPKINILGDFSDCRELTKPLVIDGIFEDMPYGFVVADSTIAAISSQMGENQLFCVNIPSGERTSTLKIGRGPGEAFHANSIQIQEDTISVAVDPEETFRYLLQECKSGNSAMPIISLKHSGIVAGNEIIAQGHNHDDKGNSTLYSSVIIKDTVIRYWGDFPYGDKMKYPLEDESKQTAYQGHLFASPDGSKAVVPLLYTVGFDVIDIRSHSVKHHIWITPQVTIRHIEELNVNLVRRAPAYETGFDDASATNQAIYLLYKKGNLSYVLKYDWKGKPETEYKIGPVDLEKIYVAPDGSKLYALANDEKKCNLYIFDIGKLKI